jgi:hypothetical protein
MSRVKLILIELNYLREVVQLYYMYIGQKALGRLESFMATIGILQGLWVDIIGRCYAQFMATTIIIRRPLPNDLSDVHN